MASWKCAIYVAIGIGIFILAILLNFDFLPNRMATEDRWTSTTSNGWDATPTVLTTTATPTTSLISGEMTLEKFNDTKWNCSNFTTSAAQSTENSSYSMCYTPQDPSICVNDPLHCNHPGTSGKRHLLWPKYGEYRYLPKSMWILVLRHGGVVLLYHPCAKEDTINRLRSLAKSCLRRYVISPSELLEPQNQTIAMVTWSCIYSAPGVNTVEGQWWIKEHAMRGPATHVTAQGQYQRGLIEPSQLVSDDNDDENAQCPLDGELDSEIDDENNNLPSLDNPQDDENSPVRHSKEEFLFISESEHKVPRRQEFDKYNAAWALGSLVFLCVVLGGVLLYSRLWETRDYYWRVENYNSNVNFSLPKKKRSKFKIKWKSKALGKSAAYCKLLNTIPEEPSDDI